MMINLIDFNSVDSQNVLSGMNGPSEKDGRFLSLVEDKIKTEKPAELTTEKNKVKQQVEPDTEKADIKKLSEQKKSDKKNVKKSDNDEDVKDVEEGDNVRSEIVDLTKKVMHLMSQIEENDPALHKVVKKEFNLIKSAVMDMIKSKDVQEDVILRKLMKFFGKLKVLMLSKGEQQEMNVETVSIDKKSEKAPERQQVDVQNENGNGEESKQKNNAHQDEMNKILAMKNVEIVKKGKNNKRSEKKGSAQKVDAKTNDQAGTLFQNSNVQKTEQAAINNEIKEAAQLKKADIPKMIERVAQKVKVTLAENKSEVIMQLKPEFLGRVQVKLEMEGKKISAKFIVDNAHAEKIFKDSIPQLKVNFQNMGLDVQEFDVRTNDGKNAGFFNSFENSNRQNSRTSDLNFTEDNEELMPGLIENYDKLTWLAQNVNMTI